MDFRLRKLRVALWIMGLGTLVAIVWHGWQGWGLGRGYPDNTYLYIHQSHYTDWTGVVQFSALPTPYTHEFAFYFPATYAMFQPFVWLDSARQREVWPDQSLSLVLYLATVLVGTLLVQRHLLREMVPNPVKRLLAALVLTIASYPVASCFDRGNVELAMALFTGWALLLCRRVKFAPAAALISISILLKLYPVLLLALFVRRKHLRYVAVPIIACVVLSILAMLTFTRPISECLALWHRNIAQYQSLYMIANRGLGGSASPWNMMKVVLLSAEHLGLVHLDFRTYTETPDRYAPVFLVLSKAYNVLFLALTVGVAAFATFVEREFFRRAILFLLFISICAQAGADYKLIWVHVALVILILLRTRRRLDLAALVLMALVLVPKKELFLTYLGPTDTTYNDVSVGVLLDPLLVLAALVLVMIDGWRNRVPGWAIQRGKGLVHQLMDMTPWRGRWRRIRSRPAHVEAAS